MADDDDDDNNNIAQGHSYLSLMRNLAPVTRTFPSVDLDKDDGGACAQHAVEEDGDGDGANDRSRLPTTASAEQKLCLQWLSRPDLWRTLVLMGDAGTGKSYTMWCMLTLARVRHRRFTIVMALAHKVLEMHAPYAAHVATVASVIRMSDARTGVRLLPLDAATQALAALEQNMPPWFEAWCRLTMAEKRNAVVAIDEIGLLAADTLDALMVLFSLMVNGDGNHVHRSLSVLLVGDTGQHEAIDCGPRRENRLSLTAASLQPGQPVLVHVLRCNHRSHTCERLQALLSAMRSGRFDASTIELVRQRSCQYPWVPGGTVPITAKTICATNAQVHQHNAQWLSHIDQRDGIVVRAHFKWADDVPDKDRQRILRDHRHVLPDATILAPHQPVRVTTNQLRDIPGLCNNATGTVERIDDDASPLRVVVRLTGNGRCVAIPPVTTPIVGVAGRSRKSRPLLWYTAMPLAMDYARTAARVQGMTITGAIAVDLHELHGCNEAYTVVSRVTRIEDVHLTHTKPIIDFDRMRVHGVVPDRRSAEVTDEFIRRTRSLRDALNIQ